MKTIRSLIKQFEIAKTQQLVESVTVREDRIIVMFPISYTTYRLRHLAEYVHREYPVEHVYVPNNTLFRELHIIVDGVNNLYSDKQS